jgi:NAD(P)-dependent dehydrogenase (short-subunit alcohol dehydrogenase family)
MAGRVAGKVAIVTGAASGMGAAHARLLASEGARVMCVDIQSEPGEALAEEIRAAGGDARFHLCDVTSLESWTAVVQATLAEWERIDVLVNNAGVIRVEDFVEETLEGWNEVVNVDQLGVFLGMKAVIPVMLEQRSGSVINIASNQGIAALPGYAAYHAAKGAVVMMSKAGAVTYGPYGIRVNSVCPGMVETPMSEGHEANEPMIAATPLRRGATPEEISPGVLFLAADESRFVTGTELIMDGGYLAV